MRERQKGKQLYDVYSYLTNSDINFTVKYNMSVLLNTFPTSNTFLYLIFQKVVVIFGCLGVYHEKHERYSTKLGMQKPKMMIDLHNNLLLL